MTMRNPRRISDAKTVLLAATAAGLNVNATVQPGSTHATCAGEGGRERELFNHGVLCALLLLWLREREREREIESEQAYITSRPRTWSITTRIDASLIALLFQRECVLED